MVAGAFCAANVREEKQRLAAPRADHAQADVARELARRAHSGLAAEHHRDVNGVGPWTAPMPAAEARIHDVRAVVVGCHGSAMNSRCSTSNAGRSTPAGVSPTSPCRTRARCATPPCHRPVVKDVRTCASAALCRRAVSEHRRPSQRDQPRLQPRRVHQQEHPSLGLLRRERGRDRGGAGAGGVARASGRALTVPDQRPPVRAPARARSPVRVRTRVREVPGRRDGRSGRAAAARSNTRLTAVRRSPRATGATRATVSADCTATSAAGAAAKRSPITAMAMSWTPARRRRPLTARIAWN